MILGMVLVGGQAASSAATKAFLTLDNTRWDVRVSVVRVPKFAKASGFRDVLFFRAGTVSGTAHRKRGLDMIPYQSEKMKGSKTDWKWSFAHHDSVSDKYEWQGIARLYQHRTWKMKGTLTRTTPDGQVYKYVLHGAGRPYTPETFEPTPSGK